MVVLKYLLCYQNKNITEVSSVHLNGDLRYSVNFCINVQQGLCFASETSVPFLCSAMPYIAV